jgi:hypothetical protein
MDLAVNHAGENVKALTIDNLPCRREREIADGGDTPILNADVALALAILIDDDPALKNAIEGLGHHSTP